MQVFLPLPSIYNSVKCLDNKRLQNQRKECRQILDALRWGESSWKNHPAVKMYKGYEDFLEKYLRHCILEFIRRGGNNNMIIPVASMFPMKPEWFGDPRLHASHRANLLRKNPKWYGQFNWSEEPFEGYWWPVPVVCKKTKEAVAHWNKLYAKRRT